MKILLWAGAAMAAPAHVVVTDSSDPVPQTECSVETATNADAPKRRGATERRFGT